MFFIVRYSVVFAVFLFSFIYTAKSQTFFGFKLGLGFSNVKYEDSYKNEIISPYKKIRTTILSGIVLNYSLNKIISVQPEINYFQKGFRFKQLAYSQGKSIMNYIEVPVLGKYNIIQDSKRAFQAYIGGYSAYWLFGKYISTEFSTGIKSKNKVDFKDETFQYNRVDAGLVFGFSYEFRQKKRRSSIDIRYSHGMISSSKVEADALLNRTFSVTYGYSFQIKK